MGIFQHCDVSMTISIFSNRWQGLSAVLEGNNATREKIKAGKFGVFDNNFLSFDILTGKPSMKTRRQLLELQP